MHAPSMTRMHCEVFICKANNLSNARLGRSGDHWGDANFTEETKHLRGEMMERPNFQRQEGALLTSSRSSG